MNKPLDSYAKYYPIISANLTNAVYTAKLVNIKQNINKTEKEIIKEVHDLFSYLCQLIVESASDKNEQYQTEI